MKFQAAIKLTDVMNAQAVVLPTRLSKLGENYEQDLIL